MKHLLTASSNSAHGSVKVIHGANDDTFALGGCPVSVVRNSLADGFNIPADAIAFVNGQRVPNSYECRGDEVLEFCRERGIKGAGKTNRFTEEDLNQLGFAVVGNTAIPVDSGTPDESWDFNRLEAFAKARLASSRAAGEQSLLLAHKSALDLFYAGCALRIIRDKKKGEQHGAWTEWKRERGLPDTTVNDAIRLFENAKTEEALAGLGVTEAKDKFVYPFKDQTQDEEDAVVTGPHTASESHPRMGRKPQRPNFSTKVPKDEFPDEEDDEKECIEIESRSNDATITLTEELHEIAQRLLEITQDDLGKIEELKSILDAAEVAQNAVQKLLDEVYKRLSRATSFN